MNTMYGKPLESTETFTSKFRELDDLFGKVGGIVATRGKDFCKTLAEISVSYCSVSLVVFHLWFFIKQR